MNGLQLLVLTVALTGVIQPAFATGLRPDLGQKPRPDVERLQRDRPLRRVQPDLVIANVVFPTAFSQNDRVEYSFELRNTGTGAASLPVNFRFYSLRVDGVQVSENRNGTPRQLGPGESIPISGWVPAALSWFPAPGSHTLTIVADPDGQIAESNEGNNTASLTVSVAPGSFPDVAFVSAAVDPAAPTTTTPFKVRVVITNQGTGAAPMSGRILDSPDCPGFNLSQGVPGQPAFILQPGASRTFELNAPSSWYQAGPRTCTIVVGGMANDTNLANNRGPLSFSVAP